DRRGVTMQRPHLLTAITIAVDLGHVQLFALRVQPVFAMAWAVLAGVLVLCAQVAGPDVPRSDAPDLSVDRERRGTDVARMGWSLNARTGEAGALITRRVRSTLRLRLKRWGLDAENPADLPRIDVLLGPGLWARLNGPGTTVED